GRSAVRKRHWSKRRVTDRCVVELKHRAFCERVSIMCSDAHEEIVWMLAVNQRVTVSRFSRLKKKWVALVRDGCRVEAEHGLKHEAPVSNFVFCRDHSPIRRIELVAAAGSGLLRIANECLGGAADRLLWLQHKMLQTAVTRISFVWGRGSCSTAFTGRNSNQ